MPAVQSKKFNWFRKPSAWEQSQAWRQKRRAMVEEFQYNAALLSNTFATAQSDKISGSANLAAEAASARVQAAIAAKLNKIA